jgi:hypothetical protein
MRFAAKINAVVAVKGAILRPLRQKKVLNASVFSAASPCGSNLRDDD